MSPTFQSLQIRNYRIYASGAIVSNVGTWMGRVAQDWLVLTVLTDHSATALGIVTGLQFLPFLVLAPFSGMLVDRLPKRQLLFATQTALLVTALLLAVLTATGVVELWHVYALALIQGVATAVDNPARQTFVSEMVDTPHLPNAGLEARPAHRTTKHSDGILKHGSNPTGTECPARARDRGRLGSPT